MNDDLVGIQQRATRCLDGGLDAAAGPLFSGGQPQITVPCDHQLVRVWDSVEGWSPRCWDVPAAPFDFNTYPPGRNPAWILLDFLLAEHGLAVRSPEIVAALDAIRTGNTAAATGGVLA